MPVVVDFGGRSDVKITVQVFADSHAVPEETTAIVTLLMERTDHYASSEGYELEADIYRALIGALNNPLIADPMRSEFDHAVKEYRRENLEETGEPVPDWIGGYRPGAANSGPGWSR